MQDLTLTEQQVADRTIWRNISILIGSFAIIMSALAIGVIIAAG